VNCERTAELIGPHLDGELDLTTAVDLERHVATCEACATERRHVQSIRAAVAAAPYHRAPPQLLGDVRSMIRRETRPARPPLRRFTLRFAAAVVVAAGLAWSVIQLASRPGGRDPLTRQIVDAHVRSLMADHLLDVASTDRHTVKPWFAGRLDFSPDVRDFAADGFPLAGGRLEYLDGRPAAALVYRHDRHVLNAFVWPATPAAPDSPPTTTTDQGYTLLHFTDGGLAWHVISDAGPTTLEDFARVVRRHAPPATTAPVQ
jgi:anti-sigma factor RsiW